MLAIDNNIEAHRITGEQAFTKDNFLIYNIFVYELPERTTVPKIYEYFQKFGTVLDVRLLGKNDAKKCFVHFAEPIDAAKVLRETCHIFMDCVIRVKASHSLHQPDGQKIINVLESLRRNSATENANLNCNLNRIDQDAKILTLNDDCLEHICKKLSLTDQINFALSCQRFYDILVMLSKVQHATLKTKMFSGWTLLNIRIFLEIVGPQVKTLEACLGYYFDTVLMFLVSFCTNVEKLKVIGIKPGKVFIKKMKLLQEIELIDIELSNSLIECLGTLQNLKFLKIAQTTSSNVCVKNIHILSGLEKLSLRGCSNLKLSYFRSICKNLKNLYYLDIRDCEYLKTEHYESILEHLLQLKILKLSCANNGDFSCIAQLPNLKSLEICRNVDPDSAMEGFLKNLAKFRANELEELKLVQTDLRILPFVSEFKKLKVLYCNYSALEDGAFTIFPHLTELEVIDLVDCLFITDEIMLEILKNCLKLKHINVHRCMSLTSNFLSNALKLLQDQRRNFLRTCCVLIEVNPHECICSNFARDDFADVLKINCIPRVVNIYSVGAGYYYDDEDEWDDSLIDYDYLF